MDTYLWSAWNARSHSFEVFLQQDLMAISETCATLVRIEMSSKKVMCAYKC